MDMIYSLSITSVFLDIFSYNFFYMYISKPNYDIDFTFLKACNYRSNVNFRIFFLAVTGRIEIILHVVNW